MIAIADMEEKNIVSEEFLTIYTEVSQLPIFAFPHRLERSVFALCFQGEMRVQVDLKDYLIQKNDFMLAAPGQMVQAHGCTDDFKGFCFAADKELTVERRVDMEDMLPLFFYLQENPVTRITNRECEVIVEYLHMIQRKMADHSNCYRCELVHSLMRAFLYELNNMLRLRLATSTGKKSRKEIQFETFMHYVSKYFRKNRSVMFYANEMCISPKHLSRIIKEVSGRSASDWIDTCVVTEAKSLLKTSRMTIDEISNELNFANQSFFGKYFKQHTGMTPSQYRTT